MTATEILGSKRVCLHKESLPCDDPTCCHVQLFANLQCSAKIAVENLRDIEVCATFVRPVRKANLLHHHTKTPMSFYDWLTYARQQVTAQWAMNCAPQIGTTSVASLISTDDIMNSYLKDAEPWAFIATPKDKDTIAIGKTEAKYQDKADYFVVLQSYVHVPRHEIVECFERALESADGSGYRNQQHQQMEELEMLQRVTTALICAAERGATNRLYRNAITLGFEVDEEESDIYGKRIMPFASAANIRMFEMHLPHPKAIRTVSNGLYERYNWRRCTVSIRNSMYPIGLANGETMFGIVQGAIDLGHNWSAEGLHAHIHKDEGVLTHAMRLHGGPSGKWNRFSSMVCPDFMERRRSGKEKMFEDVLANLDCVHVDMQAIAPVDV